jgi:hypothetical protein
MAKAAKKKPAPKKAPARKKAKKKAPAKKAPAKKAPAKKAEKKKAKKKAAARALPKEGLSMRAYAARRKSQGLAGGTHVAVRKAILDGRLTAASVTQVGQRTMIEPELADKEWAESTHTGQTRDPAKMSKGRKAAASRKRAEELEEDPALSQHSLFGVETDPQPQERARALDPDAKNSTAKITKAATYFGALLKKLEYEEKSGALVRKDAVDSEVFSSFRGLRDRILGIPDRIGSILAAESDVATIRERLRDELVECLEALANDLKRD